MDQPGMMDTKLGTLKATSGMCQVGQLKLPQSESYLQKRTQVSTTSRRLFETLHTQRCPKNHDHEHIKGKAKINGKWVNVSSFAKGYTVGFARKIASCICNWGFPESPLIVEEMILGLEEHDKPEMAPEALQLQKRRRVTDKQPETSMYGKAPTWEAILRTVGYQTPRVGNFYFEEGELVTGLGQQLVPELKIKVMIACRGTERYRTMSPPPGGERYPWRKTVIVERGTGSIRDMGSPRRVGKVT